MTDEARAAGAALDAALARIWHAHLGERIALLETIESAVGNGPGAHLAEAEREQARRAAHRLAGSLGTFGLGTGSDLARLIETDLDQRDSGSHGDPRHLADLVAELSRVIRSFAGPPAAPAAAVESPTSPEAAVVARTVQLVGMEDAQAQLVVGEAAVRGLLASIASLDDVARSAERQAPDATVIDLDHAEAVVDQLLRAGGPIRGGPVVALSSGRRFADRVTAARLGARRYLPKPVTAASIVDAVEALWPTSRPIHTVVAVDDDPVVLDTLRALLASDDIDLVTVHEQEGFWLALQEHQPDLVVLDVDMPGVDGIELCRVLRSDERWQQVGVVFLTSRGDADTLREVFAAGADDLVVKPVVGPELRTRINSRIERTDLHRRLAETDGLTGLANRATFQRELDRMLSATDSITPICFVLLDLDHFKRVNDTHGHQVGDEVLRRLAELMPNAHASCASRLGGEEFGVLFESVGTDEAYRRTEELLKRFSDERFYDRTGSTFNVSFSAGLAGYPDDADDATSLYRAADLALYRAKARGRGRVVGFRELASDPNTVRAVDVIVVDDDDLVASLLVDAICNRGWSVERLNDGREAVARLTGPSADLRARAILLDVDLPGLDGLAVLRELARNNVVPQTRVIMLTARSHEDEVVEAFQLGAIDHVAKPFSASVLLERLRRTIEG